MAWTAKVAAKDYKNGQLIITVEYSDGAGNAFTDAFDLSGGDVEGAKSRVRARLAQLANSDSLFATVPLNFSNFAAAPPATPTAKDNFATAMRLFQRWQRAVALGLATTSTQGYIDSQQAMINLWDPSFIDVV